MFLSGCAGVATSPISTATATGVRGSAIGGSVHGGRSPISGAHVYLYAANITGYNNSSVSLLGNHAGSTTNDGTGKFYVTTDSGGSFTITSDYTCPAAASQVYLYSIGGDAGGGSSNAAAGLLASLGTCPASGTLSSSLTVVVNEATTVAMAYATAGYATGATRISSSGTALAKVGIANAFSSATNLADLTTGAPLATTPGGNGTVPQSKIDTLANILAACINSTGPSSTQCTTLFANAKNGSTAPTETATSMINIAHNPASNVATLYGIQPAVAAPYMPDLAAAPNDFTIAIPYTGAGINVARGIAIDASGNVWIGNNSGNSLSELSTLGVPISGAGGYTGGGLNGPHSVNVDTSGNVWVSNNSASSISKFDSSGNAISGGSGYTGGGLLNPTWMAFDATGNLWVNNNSVLSKFNSSGTAISGVSGYTSGGLLNGKGIGIDLSGNVWAAYSDSDSIVKFTGTTGAVAATYTGGGLSNPAILAIDGSSNVWTANYGNNSISEFDSSGSAQSGSGGFTGGLINPVGMAIDGVGNAWSTNYGSYGLSKTDSTGTVIAALLGDAGLTSQPLIVEIDGSGNAWVSNANQTVTEYVGVASPVVTPMVANLKTPYAAKVVNRP